PPTSTLFAYTTLFRSHELPAAGALLESAVVWLNDLRAIVAQAKSAFAALWTLLRRGDWLTRAEALLVERVVPPSGLASVGWLERSEEHTSELPSLTNL